MTSMLLAIVLKPFVLLLLLVPAALATWWIRKQMPDCALKRFLLISWKV